MPKHPGLIVSLCIATVAGCSMFVAAPDIDVTGPEVVCILHDGTAFKEAVIGKVTTDLVAKGYTVVADDAKRAKYYPAEDYGAVVYMAPYWMWHVPWHQTSYYRKNGEPDNTVFVVTSGDPDVTVGKPFDAITSVSKDAEIDTMANEILGRLDGILR